LAIFRCDACAATNCRTSASFPGTLRGFLERGERVAPKPIEVRAQGVDPRGIQLVEPPVSHGAIDDQTRVLQDPQVLGDCGAADRETARDLADRLRSLEQAFEDRPAGGIAQGVQLFCMSVSNQ
jgi:hypothetical protein